MLEREAYRERLKSYSASKWFGKPSCLSPLYCATYGWTCASKDTLACSCCNAVLQCSIDSRLSHSFARRAALTLAQKCVTGHRTRCAWFGSKLEDADIREIPLDSHRRAAETDSRAEGLRRLGIGRKGWNVTLCENFDEIITNLIYASENKMNRTPPTEVILASCGWRAAMTTNYSSRKQRSKGGGGDFHFNYHSLPIVTMECSGCMQTISVTLTQTKESGGDNRNDDNDNDGIGVEDKDNDAVNNNKNSNDGAFDHPGRGWAKSSLSFQSLQSSNNTHNSNLIQNPEDILNDKEKKKISDGVDNENDGEDNDEFEDDNNEQDDNIHHDQEALHKKRSVDTAATIASVATAACSPLRLGLGVGVKRKSNQSCSSTNANQSGLSMNAAINMFINTMSSSKRRKRSASSVESPMSKGSGVSGVLTSAIAVKSTNASHRSDISDAKSLFTLLGQFDPLNCHRAFCPYINDFDGKVFKQPDHNEDTNGSKKGWEICLAAHLEHFEGANDDVNDADDDAKQEVHRDSSSSLVATPEYHDV
mmetsp:Transcript_31948/g.77841  ORF Transcript_31948/g.77841 Transcript_31948/m.77841 type:complete len:535 (+) Transcript_31948:71-1675(+)